MRPSWRDGSTLLGGTATTVDLLNSSAKSSASLPAASTRSTAAKGPCYVTTTSSTGTFWSRPPVTQSSLVSSTLNAHPSTIRWLISPKRSAMPPSISQSAPRSYQRRTGSTELTKSASRFMTYSTLSPNGCGSAPTGRPVGGVLSGSLTPISTA